MPTINRSALVPFSARQMYDLVNNVAAYPEFLPWCSGATVVESGADYKIAQVNIRKGPVRQHFTTRNTLQDGRQISMALVDGPFRSLDGQWQFSEIGDAGCRVSFNIDFNLSGLLLQKALGPVFNEICSRLVDAFVTRAHEQYRES